MREVGTQAELSLFTLQLSLKRDQVSQIVPMEVIHQLINRSLLLDHHLPWSHYHFSFYGFPHAIVLSQLIHLGHL
jgi:hypothetical protein